GSHSITSVYSGDDSFNASTSPADTVTVENSDTATIVTGAPDPSVFGEAKTLTAVVTAVAPGAGTPTGTATYFDGETLIGTSTLSDGVATFSTSSLSTGSHSITS